MAVSRHEPKVTEWQNISKASTGLRTIAARIRNTKTELDEMGEAMTEADYENLVKALTSARVALTNVDGSFRSTYDIMKDIAGVWKTLSSDVQAALAETLSGTRQQNIFYSLVEQFGEAEGAMASMKDSAGELESAYAIYMESISAHINKFKAAFQELSQTVMESDALKDIIDFGTKLIAVADAVAKVVNAIGGLKTVLIEIGGLVLFSKLPAIEKSLAAFGKSGGLTAVIGGFIKTLRAIPGLMKDAAASGGTFVDVLGAAVPSLTGFQVALLGVLVVLPLLIAGLNEFKKWLDETHPSLEKLTEQYEEAQRQADELNDKLEVNAERIAELKKIAASGDLSFVEQDELDRLGEENKLLEAQAEAYEKLAQAKAQLVADKARGEAEAFLRDDGTREIAGSQGGFTEKTYTGAGGLKDAIEDYIKATRDYNDAIVKNGVESRKAKLAKEAEVKSLEKIVALQEHVVELRRNLMNDPEANAAMIRAMDELLGRVDLAINGVTALSSVWNRYWNGSSSETAVREAVAQQSEYNEYLKQFGSNVDLTARKVIEARKLVGNDLFPDLEENDYVTLNSHTFLASDFGGDGTAAIVVTPVLPDGTVFDSSAAFEEYVSGLLDENGHFDLTRDKKGITLGLVDEGSVDASIEKAAELANGAHEANAAFDELYRGEAVQGFIQYLNAIGVHAEKLDEIGFARMFTEIASEAGGIKEAASGVKTLAEQIEKLTSLQGKVGSLSSAFSDMTGDDKVVSFSSLSAIAEQFKDVDGISQYVARIAELRDDADGLTDVMNELLGVYISQKLAAGDLAEADEEVIEAMLREKGVVNADEAAHELLSDAKIRLNGEALIAKEGLDAFIESLGDEAAYSAGARNSLIQLATQMVQTNSTKMDFTDQLEKLRQLGEAAGVSSAKLAYNAHIQEAIAKGTVEGFMAINNPERYITQFVKEINDAAANAHFDFDFSGVVNKGGKGSSGAAKKEVEEYIAEIDRFREAIRRLNEATAEREDIAHKIDRSDSLEKEIGLQNDLIDAYKREQEALHELNEERDAALHEDIGKLVDLGFDVEYDDENNKFWVSNLEHINELKGGTTEATNEIRKSAESLVKTLEEWNKANVENSESWWTLQEGILDARKRIVDAIKEIVTRSSEAVDTIQGVYETLHKAADEYAQSGGFITVDTFQSLIALGPQYMQYLQDENGLLTITHEKIDAVIAAKTEQLALDQAMTYVKRLELALEEGAIENLDELLYATTETTNATWDLVYANLALLGLDDDQYAAAKHNIDAIRALAQSAIQSIGKSVDTFQESLTEMKSGLDDILNYVMAMLKQRIQDQINALGDLKKQYADIIAKKKESLRETKEENNYQKNVAKQVKDIAKLQAQIDALSLDNSREAQAKRAKLLEELAEKQGNLADDQADHALEATEKSLDAQQKAYEDEKDAEIKKLEDSISSTEKLYRMAIEYIRTHWATLKDELIQWNYDVGTNFQHEIEEAWAKALQAAQRYGDYVAALSQIEVDITAAGGTNHNDIVGPRGTNTPNTPPTSPTQNGGSTRKPKVVLVNEDGHAPAGLSVGDYVVTNGGTVRITAAHGGQNYESVRIAGEYGTFSGYTREDTKKAYEKFKKLVEENGLVFHNGGIVGGGTLKENEVMAKLQKGEPVISNQAKGLLFDAIELVSMLHKKLDVSSLPRAQAFDAQSIRQSMYAAALPASSINFGDVIVYGADDKAVDEIRKIKREQANEVLSYLGIRK